MTLFSLFTVFVLFYDLNIVSFQDSSGQVNRKTSELKKNESVVKTGEVKNPNAIIVHTPELKQKPFKKDSADFKESKPTDKLTPKK